MRYFIIGILLVAFFMMHTKNRMLEDMLERDCIQIQSNIVKEVCKSKDHHLGFAIKGNGNYKFGIVLIGENDDENLIKLQKEFGQ